MADRHRPECSRRHRRSVELCRECEYDDGADIPLAGGQWTVVPGTGGIQRWVSRW